MKGMIFTMLNKMVEVHMGIEAWDGLLEKVCPASKGVYTSGMTYPDDELFALVHGASEEAGLPPEALIRDFGEFMVLHMTEHYPSFFEEKTAKTFLSQINSVVHVEVQKLYPDAVLPKFSFEDPAPDRLVMTYESPRKLCVLAEGLIDGVAKYFETPIHRHQSRCMHRGDDHCRIELTFGG